jgi:hypothetical protein
MQEVHNLLSMFQEIIRRYAESFETIDFVNIKPVSDQVKCHNSVGLRLRLWPLFAARLILCLYQMLLDCITNRLFISLYV